MQKRVHGICTASMDDGARRAQKAPDEGRVVEFGHLMLEQSIAPGFHELRVEIPASRRGMAGGVTLLLC